MKKASMEGFGVIKTETLQALQPTFLILSEIIDFPTEDFQSPQFLKEIEENFAEIPEKKEVLNLVKGLQKKSLSDLKEQHTSLFELNKRLTLYTTYYRFEDSRERGTVLAKLKMLYEMFGVSLQQAELTDYLPTMLEFLGVGQFQDDPRINDLQLLFSVLEDGTYEMLRKGQEYDNEAYLALIQCIRQILRYCVIEERVEA